MAEYEIDCPQDPRGYDPRNQQGSELSKGWGTVDNTTWGHDLRSYEYTKRHQVPPGKCEGPPEPLVLRGVVANEERKFNPITQRFKDPKIERVNQRTEHEITVEHLNRARDIQNLREQHHDIVHNGSKLLGLEDTRSPEVKRASGTQDPGGKMVFPDSNQGRVDYNIVSGIGHAEHHWAPPQERPLGPIKIPRAREVPGLLQRDFNIVSNRYKERHDEKTARDHELAKAEATAKHHLKNRFHPLAQKFIVQDEESRMQVADECHNKEETLLRKQKQPPTMKHRATAFYNPVNHAFKDEQMLKWMDLVEDERKLRYRTKHFVELDIHNRNLACDNLEQKRKLNRQHWFRHSTERNRGHDIINNHHYEGREAVPPFRPYAEPHMSPWEDAMMRNGKDMSNAPESKMGKEALRMTTNPNATPFRPSRDAGSLTDRTRPGPMERLNLATPRMPSGSSSLDRTRMPVRAFDSSAPPAPSLPASSRGSAVYSHGN
jgi:hypothetical protein